MAHRRGIDAYWLKMVAIVGMTCNHIAHVFASVLPEAARLPLYALGGLTFPIMAYLLIDGYRYTSNLKRYLGRLAVFAAISVVPFWLAFGTYVLDVLVTLLLGLLALVARDRIKDRRVYILCLVGLVLVSGVCDWNFIGVPLIVAMGAIEDRRRRAMLPISVMVLAMEITFVLEGLMGNWAWDQMGFFATSLIAMALLLAYNGQRGRRMKYFFYAYYPAHLLALVGLYWAMFGR